jgi:peptidoglycan/LPS O-acetylase OafA/YrhL
VKLLNTKVLDGLRILLALWVACGHFYIIIGGKKLFEIPVVSTLLQKPIVAVNGFMMITGFLMTYHYILREKKEPFLEATTGIKFILRRLFRLYPVYLIAIIAAFFLVENMYLFRKEALEFFTGSSMTAFGAESKLETPTLLGLLSHLFFVHGFFPHQDSSILSVAWSLSLEMQFYVLFPVIFAFLFRKQVSFRFVFMTVLAIAASAFSLKYFMGYFEMPAALIFRMPIFLLGIMLAAAALDKLKWRYVILNSAVILAFEDKFTIVLAVGIAAFMFAENLKRFLPKSVYAIVHFFVKLLSSKTAKIGADVSYSLYLMHMILLPFLLKFFIGLGLSKLMTAGLTFAAFIVINFALSYVIHLYVEQPFIRIGKQVVDKIKPARPSAGLALNTKVPIKKGF